MRTWSTTSPPTGERHSTLATPPTGNSWPGSTPTATGSYSAPIPATDAQIYGHKQKRRIDSSESDSNPSLSNSTSASIGRTTIDDFQYDWESVYPGFHPEETMWGDPRLMKDSPPNPRNPVFYSGLSTSRLIAGAGPDQDDMGDVADPWNKRAPQQPPAPQQPLALPQDRTDQLIQQVALLWDENLRLQNNVMDLRQHANQRGRPRAPAYAPDLDHYSIPQPPG